jgi:membrane associated rhomboid family serine protease
MLWLLPVGEEETSRHLPWATWTLVALNVLAFAAMLLSPLTLDEWCLKYGLVPAEPSAWTFLTSQFTHGGWLHIIFNMLFLLLFGDNVEDILGPAGFLLLYFAGGLAGDITFVTHNPEMGIPSVGASGCIATLAGAYAVMLYNRRVDMDLMLVAFSIARFAVPAPLLVLFFFGGDVWLTAMGGGALDGHGGTNFVAHGVGVVVGVFAGAFALGSGAVARFRRHSTGHAWFGYLPWNLGQRTRWRGYR